MATVRLFHIVTRAKACKPSHFVINVEAIAAAWEAHAATFAGSPVDLATFQAKVAEVVDLHKEARRRVPGAAGKRNEAIRPLAAQVELFRAYVEQRCTESPEQAVTLSQSAGLHISATPVRAKVPLRARMGDHAGEVKLYACVSLLCTGRAGRIFHWEYSLDGGLTWLAAAQTTRSRTIIAGLPALKEVRFRVAVTTHDTGQGPWTASVPFLVLPV